MDVIQSNNKLIIDGVEVINKPKAIFGNSVTQCGNDIYINGYKYNKKTGQFKFSLYGMLSYIF